MVNGAVTPNASMRVGGPTRQNKAPIAISAIHIATFIDFQPHARVAKGGPARDVACAVASNAAGLDGHDFGLVDHARAISNRGDGVQPDQK